MVPARGTITKIAVQFRVSKQAVSRIWTVAQKNNNKPDVAAFTASPLKRGPKFGGLLYDRDLVSEEVASLKSNERRTIRTIAKSLNIPHSTIHRFCKNDKIIKRCTNSIKPTLTEGNKLMRLLYAADRISSYNDANGKMYFDSCEFEVHLDEKWFYITQVEQAVYLTEGETAPYRHTQHKSHIPKVMFLCAVGRPKFNEAGNCLFDGKIGIWPFTIKEAAKRKSNNRDKGTLVTKPINVNYNVYYDYFINKVIPAIKSKFPRGHNPNITIKIQHDNAPSHFNKTDINYINLLNDNNEAGWKFVLTEQPPNSPDTNTLDLGFFASIQSMQWGMDPAINIDMLIDNVETAYQKYDPHTLDRVWLSHQSCLNEIIACSGGNHYKLPHINKNNMKNRVGILPRSIEVSEEAEATLERMKIFDVANFI
jgi:tRNA uridine 5-carbamoylmethylation protein Kti12